MNESPGVIYPRPEPVTEAAALKAQAQHMLAQPHMQDPTDRWVQGVKAGLEWVVRTIDGTVSPTHWTDRRYDQ